MEYVWSLRVANVHMKLKKLQLFYLILILDYSYLLIFCETYGLTKSNREVVANSEFGSLLLVISLCILYFRFKEFQRIELLFSWILVAIFLIGSPFLHSSHQINTVFGIIGINFIFAKKKF